MFENYEIIEHRKISDLNSEGYILRHKKTKANVTLLLNDDENKVFYIGFKTPPTDSTGVAHILEHSVLCGSKKFPVKDPFIELAKGSLNTFLNAMTYPDKTVYPVASCNDKDFHNLVDVYLDAVFNPNIYKEEKIFRQEGHHYELTSPEDELIINGVVYNEMKGVYSSPDDIVDREVLNSLYPDTTYGIESGGDPDVIPSLTYEDFLAFHGRYYHPSNSYIYLYGNLDAGEYLKFIDEEYLSKYDYLEVDSGIGVQKPFEKPLYIKKEYPVLSEEESEGTYLTYNISAGTSLDRKLYIALDVLDYVLLSSPGAVIKQALLDEKIGEDVYSNLETGIYQPFYEIVVKGSSPEKEQRFVEIIEDKLNEASENGLPKKALMAALNVFEFRYRESDFGSHPRGLILGLQALDSWLYDAEAPFMHIEANDTYKFLKDNIDTGYFEKLISEYFIENHHKSIVTVVPKENLTQEKDNALKAELKAYKDSLSPLEINKIIEDTAELKRYQSEESPEEDLKKIPMLSRADLKKEAYKCVNTPLMIDDTVFVHHDIFTNGIGYLRLFFSLDNISEEQWNYLSLLREVWGLVDTDKRSYNDLFNEINIATGGMSFEYRSYSDDKNYGSYKSFLYVKTKVLYENLDRALLLIKEILTGSKYDDHKRLKEILSSARAGMLSAMISAGHQVASARALSYKFKQYAADDIMAGLSHYRFLEEITENFDERKDEITKKLYEAARLVFRPENLTVDYTSEKKALSGFEDKIRALRSSLFTDEYERKAPEFNAVIKNEAFKTAGLVQYVSRAGSYIDKNLPYTGALRVLKVIMGYDYLWNNVRVLGGAYGCMSAFLRNGAAYFVSYRDPKLENTIKVFKDAVGYIKEIDLDERKLTQFIIGALSELDVPQTPQTKGAFSFNAYMMNINDEDFQRERDELLGANEEVIRGLSKYISAFLEDEALCVVGNADEIDKCKELFSSIEKLG